MSELKIPLQMPLELAVSEYRRLVDASKGQDVYHYIVMPLQPNDGYSVLRVEGTAFDRAEADFHELY